MHRPPRITCADGGVHRWNADDTLAAIVAGHSCRSQSQEASRVIVIDAAALRRGEKVRALNSFNDGCIILIIGAQDDPVREPGASEGAERCIVQRFRSNAVQHGHIDNDVWKVAQQHQRFIDVVEPRML